jgi:16S rRNA processing protein RimM
MTIDDCFYLGKIGKPFGYKGEMNVFFDVDEPAKYSSLKSVFILTSQGLVPYMLSSVTVSSNRSTVIFDGLTSSEAILLQGKELYLPLTMLPPLTGNQFYFHEVKGFNVVDEDYGYVGILKEIIDNGPQPIISISAAFPASSEKEVLIPLIDKFIVSLDRTLKTLTIKAPEGLIEFYLEKV